MDRGYVLPSRRSPAAKQIATLEAAGVTVIYVEGRQAENFEAALKSVRPGRPLVVDTLADLATDRRQLRERMELVHGKGCYVKEGATGRDSRKHAADMIFDAADVLGQARKGHDPKLAKKFGKLGGRPKAKRAMKREDAERIWFDRRVKSNDEAVEKMTGWSMSAAYREFGSSGRPAGKRAAKK